MSMITSDQNEHNWSGSRDTRRDNVNARPVDVEIESRHNSNLGVTSHQRTTVRHTGGTTNTDCHDCYYYNSKLLDTREPKRHHYFYCHD
jgi:hypothetical protein